MQILKLTTILVFTQNNMLKVSHNTFLFLRYAHLMCEIFVYKHTETLEHV